ncbi:hypothetical protein PHYBLDRAFT_139423 [Rhizophagus clarus]|uniref:Uncharacterized protein n=1 Tax=Rhizophagus clarus TaxID=94130 RepID=A0A8H3M7E0_9GLOM|nr:hypothetical protein PHYBLDRAFT_139423 [Rhizophagus clarus]
MPKYTKIHPVVVRWTSLLNDEDFKNKCQIWLQQQTPESHSSTNLKIYIEETVFPKLTEYIKKETISEKTCRNYMHLKKWLKKMFEYKKSMKDFDSNMLDVVLEPQLKSGEKELVQVTYDECYFYANDGQQKI